MKIPTDKCNHQFLNKMSKEIKIRFGAKMIPRPHSLREKIEDILYCSYGSVYPYTSIEILALFEAEKKKSYEEGLAEGIKDGYRNFQEMKNKWKEEIWNNLPKGQELTAKDFLSALEKLN